MIYFVIYFVAIYLFFWLIILEINNYVLVLRNSLINENRDNYGYKSKLEYFATLVT